MSTNPVKIEEISNLFEKKFELSNDSSDKASNHQKKIIYFKNQDRFEGYMKDGLKNGKGIYYWSSSGDVYDGDWLNGKRTGKGIHLYSKKSEK